MWNEEEDWFDRTLFYLNGMPMSVKMMVSMILAGIVFLVLLWLIFVVGGGLFSSKPPVLP